MSNYAAQAREFARDSAKEYRRGRNALRDAERWDKFAANCDKLADYWDRCEADPDDDTLPTGHAEGHRANAESLRNLAEQERLHVHRSTGSAGASTRGTPVTTRPRQPSRPSASRSGKSARSARRGWPAPRTPSCGSWPTTRRGA